MKAPVSRSFVPAATLAMALLVSACGSDSPDALLASAQDYLSRNDAPAAIIQLKNVLKDRPDSAKARLLLGQALQATGDIAGAETEFRKAQDLGAASDEVVPQLAQACATSTRTLLRHFSATHGQSPLQYLHSLRIARAQVMLETTYLPVDQVAQACGYTDVGTFRRLFLRATQELPAAYRAHYRLRTLRTRWPG